MIASHPVRMHLLQKVRLAFDLFTKNLSPSLAFTEKILPVNEFVFMKVSVFGFFVAMCFRGDCSSALFRKIGLHATDECCDHKHKKVL
jgi:hypothetical protein